MSMPNIPDINPEISICFADVIKLLLASIALEEVSLANIMTVESEKLSYFLNDCCSMDSKKDIFKINECIERVLQNVEKIESLLIEKMKLIMKIYDFNNSCNMEVLSNNCYEEEKQECNCNCNCNCNCMNNINANNAIPNIFSTKKRKNT